MRIFHKNKHKLRDYILPSLGRGWGVGLLLLLAGCDSIDCTLNNVVGMTVGFYTSADGKACAVQDTLTVTAEGTDSVLYNRGVNVSSLYLPMSYWQEADTLRLAFRSEGSDEPLTVVLRIRKTNRLHYESPDCPATMFHDISGVDYDDETGSVDSVVVVTPTVDYGTLENLRIYLHSETTE